ncbi:MAG: very short patch repair endonuclease [Rhodospirillales bacterium]|nr:very short patch repair endonuclease [Rhodospirillales bacterium]
MTAVSEQRQRTMQAVGSCDTGPEMAVRRLLHRLGYRYRLHRADLPGKPDVVFGSRRKAIFVHGCFWRGHSCKRGSRKPKPNAEYWGRKIAGNVARDARQRVELTAEGWTALTLWECETGDGGSLAQRLKAFLEHHSGERCS